MFFTLLLLNLSTAALRKFGSFLNRDSILCMDSFAGHILKGLFISCMFFIIAYHVSVVLTI